MAFSCYANNLGDLEGSVNSEMSIFAQPQTELLPSELLGFDSNNLLFSDSSYVDPFWESQFLVYSSKCHSLLPTNYVSYQPEDPCSSLATEIFPLHEYNNYETYPFLRRQKQLHEDQSFDSEMMVPGLFNDFVVPNPSLFQAERSPEIFSPFPQYFDSNPPAYSSSAKAIEARKKPSAVGGSLSAQSVAARQRRRKITEKTQQLGKLIPGAHKMNTAEMFQAAFKYIKFLQAQLGILQTMASIGQEYGDSWDNQEMELLLGSSLIQEKLYTADKCLAPKKLVESFANHHKLKLDHIDGSSFDVKKLL